MALGQIAVAFIVGHTLLHALVEEWLGPVVGIVTAVTRIDEHSRAHGRGLCRDLALCLEGHCTHQCKACE